MTTARELAHAFCNDSELYCTGEPHSADCNRLTELVETRDDKLLGLLDVWVEFWERGSAVESMPRILKETRSVLGVLRAIADETRRTSYQREHLTVDQMVVPYQKSAPGTE